jgi:hypothetical protein
VVLLDLKSSILREVSALFPGPKTVLFRLAKFLLDKIAEQKAHLNDVIIESIKKMIYLFYFGKRARIKGLIPKLHIFGRNYIYNLYSLSNLTCLTSIFSLN